MLDPKTPLQAGLIFVGGIAVGSFFLCQSSAGFLHVDVCALLYCLGLCGKVRLPCRRMKYTVCLQVIAYTVLDINRTTRLNQQPMSPEQTRALRELARQAQTKSGK